MEGILYNPQTGKVYEGLLTNFYVITFDKNSNKAVVMTAPHGSVLEGTSCWLVEQVCQKLGIHMVWQHPNIHDIKSWNGAFISSKFGVLFNHHVVMLL